MVNGKSSLQCELHASTGNFANPAEKRPSALGSWSKAIFALQLLHVISKPATLDSFQVCCRYPRGMQGHAVLVGCGLIDPTMANKTELTIDAVATHTEATLNT